MANNKPIFDYIVIGSGFGGSVSALRLCEKNYSVLVLEKGKRFATKDFAKSNWHVRRYLWWPLLKCFGIQQIHFFNKAFILSGVGVGGGSLVYANTHMYPDKEFFRQGSWARFGNWEEKLKPFYALAKKMLGTVPVPKLHVEDQIFHEVATGLGMGHTFAPVEVGVYFSESKEEVDPYFNGEGPLRKPCTECAGCMVGCQHLAKNTLDLNYLYLAQKKGCQIRAETLVTKIENKGDEYWIHTRQSTSWKFWQTEIFRSRGVVLSAGVLGTMKILLEQKFKFQTLPKISDHLGKDLRTNSESLCGTALADRKLNNGVAISSIIHPNDNTFIEICKYPNGSGLMGRLGVLAAGPGPAPVRIFKCLGQILSKPVSAIRFFFAQGFAETSVFFLVMQTIDNSMKMILQKTIFGWKMKMQEVEGLPVPAYIEVGQEVMHRFSRKVKGLSINAIHEVLYNLPSTAHILGGCPMGAESDTGVINDKFQLNGYDNFYVLDASVISANLGVNPSLSITAISEYAMSLVPESGGRGI
ncbi:MAG: GMC family oxidoreductase [Bdellovibrionales bacterium]|nr:GMC family oxidoreductase [Bdellovibrionales bacterium]